MFLYQSFETIQCIVLCDKSIWGLKPLKWIVINRTFNLEINFINWNEDSAVVLSCIVSCNICIVLKKSLVKGGTSDFYFMKYMVYAFMYKLCTVCYLVTPPVLQLTYWSI